MAELIIDTTAIFEKILADLDELYGTVYMEAMLEEKERLMKQRELEDIERRLNPLKFRLEAITKLRETLRSIIDKEGKVK